MNKKENQPPTQIINPFSDKFLEAWKMWKDYKKETFGFEYKGFYSEQMTLKKLVELSDGEEDKAIGILEQSIMRQWQGLFPLHIPTKNGKSRTKQSAATENPEPKPTSSNLRERVSSAFDKRYGDGQQDGNESYLKAV